MALTGKKRLFADAVLAGQSNKDAAIAAGYSAATAAQSGSRMAKDAAVAAFIAEHRGSAPISPAPVVPRTVERPAFDVAAAMLHSDPKQFLTAAMNDGELEMKQRIDAAKALMPFVHSKLGEGGKKDQQQDAAKRVAGGKFAAAAPPKLIVNNR